MDFLILRPLPPKTGYHFFEGGWGGGWVGGGGGGGAKVGRLGFEPPITRMPGRLRYHSATTWIPGTGLRAAWGRICY